MPATYNLGSFTQETQKQCLVNPFIVHSTSTATSLKNTAGRRLITYTGGALAIVLSTPNIGTDDGMRIQVINATNQAHTITCTSKLNNGSSNVSTATFAANPGGALTIVAYNGAWYVESQQGVSFS